MDFERLIEQFKDVERASISDIDTLLGGAPLLAKEAHKLLLKIKKFEKRYPDDGSESEYEEMKRIIREKDREISTIKNRQKNESILLRKEMGKYGKQIEDLKNIIENEKERTEKYKVALKQSEILIENMKKASSSEDDLNEIKRLKAELHQKNNEIISLKSDSTISKLHNEINILQKGLSRAELELNEFKNNSDHEKSRLKRIADEAKHDAENSKNALDQAQYTIVDLKKRVSNDYLEREIERLKKDLEEANRMDMRISTQNLETDDPNSLKKNLELKKAQILRIEEERNNDRKIYRSKMEESYKEIDRLKNILKQKDNSHILNDTDNESEKEIIVLREKLERANTLIKNLKNYKPRTSVFGQSGAATWGFDYKKDKHLLILNLNGTFTYDDAKKATRSIETLVFSIDKGFDVVLNISLLDNEFDKKTAFLIRKIVFLMQSAEINSMYRIAPIAKQEYFRFFDPISPKKPFDVFDYPTNEEVEKKFDIIIRI